MVRHFLDIHRLEASELRAILDDAHARKQARRGWPQGRADAFTLEFDLTRDMGYAYPDFTAPGESALTTLTGTPRRATSAAAGAWSSASARRVSSAASSASAP